jgi:sialic acid synthase SpsE
MSQPLGGGKMADEEIKEQILFVLEDDNEGMRAALDSDLDEQNKEMNRELIQEHERIIEKVGSGETLTADDLVLIRDANEIHLNDSNNLAGRHREAVMLEGWLRERKAASVQ